MNMISHSCIKCRERYEDNDPDDYYCEKCNSERKRIAAEIDKTVRPSKKVMSALEEFDASPKVHGKFVHVKL